MLSNQWRKSSYSGIQECVEVRGTEDRQVEVRDSKDPGAGELKFTQNEWAVFIQAVKEGQFDLPKDVARD